MSNFGGDKSPAEDSASPRDDAEPSQAPRELKVIDWDEATATAGDNLEFLKELITDLLNEARAAEEEIGDAIKNSNYTVIMRAAHRIGGTCSYFCCEAILDICHKLKTAGHDGMKSPENSLALREEFDILFNKFVQCLKALREQIALKFAE
jgi:HPt (histidine-containing phosphotransfer) domain-containing protein